MLTSTEQAKRVVFYLIFVRKNLLTASQQMLKMPITFSKTLFIVSCDFEKYVWVSVGNSLFCSVLQFLQDVNPHRKKCPWVRHVRIRTASAHWCEKSRSHQCDLDSDITREVGRVYYTGAHLLFILIFALKYVIVNGVA